MLGAVQFVNVLDFMVMPLGPDFNTSYDRAVVLDIPKGSKGDAEGVLLRNKVGDVALLKTQDGVPFGWRWNILQDGSPSHFDIAEAAKQLPGVTGTKVDLRDQYAAQARANGRDAGKGSLPQGGVTFFTADAATAAHVRSLISDVARQYKLSVQVA